MRLIVLTAFITLSDRTRKMVRDLLDEGILWRFSLTAAVLEQRDPRVYGKRGGEITNSPIELSFERPESRI
jgi:adenylylsulfate kinase-like enzyme